jgi:hypothetical protein
MLPIPSLEIGLSRKRNDGYGTLFRTKVYPS